MNDFEKISDRNIDDSGGEMRENCIYWLQGDKYVTVNLISGSRLATRVRDLVKRFPDDVKIESEKHGVMIATLPLRAVKIGIKDMKYTDEERKAIGERLRNVQNRWDNNGD